MRFIDVLKQNKISLYNRFETIIYEGKNTYLRNLGKNDYTHSETIEKILDKLIPDHIKTNINFFDPGEIFILLVAIYLHDIWKGCRIIYTSRT